MKISLLVPCVAACLATGVVVADDEVDESKPIELTTSQMDQITAGTGRDNVAEHAWAALFAAGLTPMHNAAADGGVIDHAGFNGVLIPLNPNKP
jgi:hypothetical protein